MENERWYAVQAECTDDWDCGSYDLEEAIEMAKQVGDDSLIAVIENDCCVDELYNGIDF